MLFGGILAISLTTLVVVALDIAALLWLLRRRMRPSILGLSIPTWLMSHSALYMGTLGLNWLIAHSPASAYLLIIYPTPLPNLVARYTGLMQCIVWPILVIGILVLAISGRLRYHCTVIVLVVIMPLAAMIGLDAVGYGIFVPRHALMTLLVLALIMVRWRSGAPLLIIVLIAQSVLALSLHYRANPYKANWRQIVAYVETKRAPSEPVVTARVLLDMLSREASYHFGYPVASDIPSAPTYWFIATLPEQAAPTCQHVLDAGEREVLIYYCQRGSG